MNNTETDYSCVLNDIRSITEEKIRQNKHPTHVLWLELQPLYRGNELFVKRAVNSLVKDSKITFGPTINDIYIKLK